MPRIESRKVWQAEVELAISRLALSVQYVEKGIGSQRKRCLTATDWLDKDGQTIILDVGKKLKGWLKEVVGTMKQSAKDKIQYGLVSKSLPQPGYIPIAKITDIASSTNWASFQHVGEYDLHGLPEPNVEVMQTPDKRTIFALHYVLDKVITVKATIYCFAHGISAESVKDWLETLGPVKGLGDLHSSSAGYGTFTLKSFVLKGERELHF